MKTQFLWNDFCAEIAFADKQRRDENSWRGNFRQNFFDLRFLFPERLAHLREEAPAAQFRRVPENRRGGSGVQIRAVAHHHECGVGEIIAVHAQWLARLPRNRKRSPPWKSNSAHKGAGLVLAMLEWMPLYDLDGGGSDGILPKPLMVIRDSRTFAIQIGVRPHGHGPVNLCQYRYRPSMREKESHGRMSALRL